MPRTVRRLALLPALIALAGVVALVTSGEAPPVRAAAAPVPRVPATDLPPVPTEWTPTVVEPVAGAASAAPEPVAARAAQAPATDAPEPRRAASTSAELDLARPATAGDGLAEATALSNGIALPPLEAPEAVRQMIEAGNQIARTPYLWGGGHGKWVDEGYDCSGSVSFVLASGGFLDSPLASGPLMSWGEPGPGKWVTIYSHQGHVFMEVAGIRFDTSGARETGSRWQNDLRSTAGFVARHPPGL